MQGETKYYNRQFVKKLGKALGLLFAACSIVFLIWLIVLSPIPMIP